jgi:hypothetical protein
MARSESSVGSSSEVNSLVSFKPTKNIEDTVKELDKIMENLDLGESLGYSDKGSNENFDNHPVTDLTTQSGGVSDSTEDTWRLEEKYTNNIHQMCIIISEAAEEDMIRITPMILGFCPNLSQRVKPDSNLPITQRMQPKEEEQIQQAT